jgi:uncharacterized protein YndB with AHSA1/START domain
LKVFELSPVKAGKTNNLNLINMETTEKTLVTVASRINTPVENVWLLWTDPKHIIRWNNASDDWYTPLAENDLRVGGRFLSRMEAKDGSSGFDFSGRYTKIELYKCIDYTMDDNRKVHSTFDAAGKTTKITVTFEAEDTNSKEMQRGGWQSILDNFKKYAETSGKLVPVHFEITINATTGKVYKTMLDEKTYSEWTSEFNPTSQYDGSWEKGSKILFFGTDPEGSTGGMISRIEENIPNRFLSIKHVGIIQKGKEITSGPEVDKWAGAMENYTFREVNGKTLLLIDTDTTEEFKSYFAETWPKALDKLKLLCEEV